MPTTRLNQRLRTVLLVAFLIAAALIAYLTFVAMRDLVQGWEMTGLPGIAVHDATPTPFVSGSEALPVVNNAEDPLQLDIGPTPPAWDGAQRVTLLAMGLDYRDWQTGEGPPRTDTMVLLTLDPINQTIGMLSLPRDLWVNIPGYGYGRINTAYQIGEGVKYPGGGPALAMKTVEAFLGVPVDYYAQIDFFAFEQFVDIIGGVKLDIIETIKVDPINGEIKTLKPGVQTLNGSLALAYARTRKTDGADFDRADRTQQVIMAIRSQTLREDVLPTLLTKAPQIYNTLSKGVRTNLNLDQVLRLGWLATQIPAEKYKRGIIGPPDQVSFAVSPDGKQQVLKPITEKIRLLRDEIFTATGPTSPLAANLDQKTLIQTEAARISLLNGTSTAGLAARTIDYLKTQGITVTSSNNAQKIAPYTSIMFYSGKPYTVKYLVDLFKIDPFRIRYTNDPNSPVDITITLGNDWTAKNPLP